MYFADDRGNYLQALPSLRTRYQQQTSQNILKWHPDASLATDNTSCFIFLVGRKRDPHQFNIQSIRRDEETHSWLMGHLWKDQEVLSKVHTNTYLFMTFDTFGNMNSNFYFELSLLYMEYRWVNINSMAKKHIPLCLKLCFDKRLLFFYITSL